MLQCFAPGDEALDSTDRENLSTILVSMSSKYNPVDCRIRLILNTVTEHNCSIEGAVRVRGVSSEAPL